jgi:hypothetical protein
MTQVRPARFQPTATATRATTSSSGTVQTGTALQQAAGTAASCTCGVCAGLQCLDRTRFFAGQLLTEADLNNEQSYLLAKNRLHNRYLHGWGVVCGLQVTCSSCEGWVVINPGYAIDPCGNDIIVCSAQGFNVLQAIQACCAPPAPATNCQPLRYSPPPDCAQTIQQWCITVQYQEQPTQMVTPLQQAKSATCGCGGASAGGCTCGCSGSSTTSGCGCGGTGSMSSTTSTTATSSVAGCEPSRILEGFQFGVCSMSSASTGPQPGTLAYAGEQCVKSITALAQQAPDLTSNPNMTLQQMYQAVSSYLYLVQQYFAAHPTLTNCKVMDGLNAIVVPQPTGNTSAQDYIDTEAEIGLVVVVALFECVCVALLPQCPPNPCDNRVPIACVSVQNGAIVDICHFQCRKQLIGATALQYWLEPLFAAFWSSFGKILENFCCTSSKDNPRYFNMLEAFDIANLTNAGFTNAAAVNRTVNSFVAQRMGASVVNTVNPGLNAIDMRPFVGQPVSSLQKALESQVNKARATSANPAQLDIQNVDSDPSWDLSATSAGADFAPAAVSSGQPLTVYVKGEARTIVGIEVTDPTRALQLQVQSLSDTVAGLQAQLNSASTQQAPPPDSSKKPK